MLCAAIAAPVSAGFITAAFAAGFTSTNVAQAGATGCTTALGIAPTPSSTVSELAGPQAVDATASRPALATATGRLAADTLDTLYRLDNWRDLDRQALADWLADPSALAPTGATLSTTPVPQRSTATRATDMDKDYLARCEAVIDTLAPDRRDQLLTPPALDVEPTGSSTQVHEVVVRSLGSAPPQPVWRLVANALGTPEAGLTDLLWSGRRVAPAAVAPGDLVFFDYGTAGPHQVAVVLDNTTVASTLNLDGRTPSDPTLRPGPIPTGNIVVIRPADSKERTA
ncbi:Uncharacterised protein [Mycolicibacterium fortuitum]|uniref:Uncharacterized protein n=1 Tax=Mycolicibacterium fortuitum TaxID=1766 RepID=A0A378WF32_MYCFO|nr:Uncharacterised protein [Mycolicibacterium fortuitum]